MQVQQTPNVKEIGNSINSMNLEYAEITKYSKGHNTKSDNEEDKIILTKIKFFFMRHSHLISIQYVYQQKKNCHSNDKSTFIYPPDHEFFGPSLKDIEELYQEKKMESVIDEIILNLSPNEYIYQVKGSFDSAKNKITKMVVKTTKGQFVDFGNGDKFDFTWDFYFNQKSFDGFIIGWNKKNINYLASILVDKEIVPEKETLTDVTYTQNSLKMINPIYQSQLYGIFNSMNTTYNDPYLNNDIFNLLREGKIYLGEICVYYYNTINKIDILYSYYEEDYKKIKISYTATNLNQNTNKQYSITLGPNEFISSFHVGYDHYIEWLRFSTNKRKELYCKLKDAEKDGGSKDNTKYLVGLVAGYKDRIQCIRFYYQTSKILGS